MKSGKPAFSVIFTILIFALPIVSCYTIPPYEISGTWKRAGKSISEHNGVISAHPIEYSLSFYADSTYRYACNHLKSHGRVEILGDTVVIRGPKKSMSRYLFSVDGNTLKLFKLDNNYIPTCVAGETKDAFAGAWHHR